MFDPAKFALNKLPPAAEKEAAPAAHFRSPFVCYRIAIAVAVVGGAFKFAESPEVCAISER